MTAKWFSHIPGHPYPKHEARFPSSQAVADYFERHARQDGIDLRLDTNVKRIQASAGGWQLATSHGAIDAGHVVVATGYAHTPYVPNWPGVQRFGGEVLHSSLYERREAYRGKRVLVVGAGPSGLQVAHDLAAVAAEVWLAVRTPPNIFARHRCWGNSVDVLAGPLFHAPVRAADGIARFIQRRTVGDLSKHGLPLPRLGPFTSAARNQPVTVVDMEVIASLRDRRIAVVSTVDRFHDAGVSLADGTRLRPDVVICATGYRTGLEPLVGHLGVLDAGGVPARLAPEPAANRLWFIGYQRRPNLIGHAARQSREVANQIARQHASVLGRSPGRIIIRPTVWATATVKKHQHPRGGQQRASPAHFRARA